MTDTRQRMLDKSRRPEEAAVAQWLGAKSYQQWRQIVQFIDDHYPGVFPADDWLFGGKEHGWGLRFKKSKAFCTLVPERRRLLVVIVLGRPEREKAEAILGELSPYVREEYSRAKTYHDGKWLALVVNSSEVLSDIKRLLVIKRKPKSA